MENQNPNVQVQVTFESTETHNPEASTKLKDFLNTYTTSLRDLLVEQDFVIKFNNNNLSKVLLNNQIKDLVNKFHGNRLDITPTEETVEEIKSLFLSAEEKQTTLLQINNENKKSEEEKLNLLADKFPLIEKKMKSFIKPLDETNVFFIKCKQKIIKQLSNYDIMFKEATPDVRVNLVKTKITENLNFFTKIINFCLNDTLEFAYKYGKLFLNNKHYFRIFSEILLKIYSEFTKELNENLRTAIEKDKISTEKQEEYTLFFTEIEKEVIYYRIFRYLDTEQQPSIVFLSCEEPVNVNISELEYNEIKGLLTQHPNYSKLKKEKFSSLTDKDFLKEAFTMTFERDVRVFDIYGIKMEDFLNAILLYEN